MENVKVVRVRGEQAYFIGQAEFVPGKIRLKEACLLTYALNPKTRTLDTYVTPDPIFDEFEFLLDETQLKDVESHSRLGEAYSQTVTKRRAEKSGIQLS